MRTLVNAGEGDKEPRGVPTIKRNVGGVFKEYIRYLNNGHEEFYEHAPGNVYLPFNGRMHVIAKGERFEVSEVEASAVMNLCPHLIPYEEAEYAKQQAAALPEAMPDSPAQEEPPATEEMPVKRGRPSKLPQ